LDADPPTQGVKIARRMTVKFGNVLRKAQKNHRSSTSAMTAKVLGLTRAAAVIDHGEEVIE
jgi:hypothetical protein